MTIYNILSELKADNSRLAKEAILTREKDNKVLKEFFRLALDPHIQFYQRKIPVYSTDWNESFVPLDYAMENVADRLSTRTVTGNAAIDYLTKQLSLLSPDDAKVLELLIQKDPDCGVSEATVNKIWPGLIPTFPVMLCSPFEQKLADRLHWKRGVYVQLKSDGVRVSVIIKDGAVSLYSRNGKPFEVHGVFDYLTNYVDNVVIDGELLVKDKSGKILDRKTGNGICSKAQKGTITPEQCQQFFINAWDLIPYEDFKNEVCTDEYETRYNRLFGFVYDSTKYAGKNNIGVIETQTVHSLDEAQKIFEGYLAKGEEGAIIKDRSVIWESKRSKQLIKLKSELDADLLVVGVKDGEGKYAGQIGALICSDADGIINVNVGSGLNDEDRKQTKESYIGKIITVTYNAKIQSKDGTWSLFLPRFIEVRNDKHTADVFTNIK